MFKSQRGTGRERNAETMAEGITKRKALGSRF